MNNNERLELYLYNRILWWQGVFEEMTAETVAAIVSVLEQAQKEANESLRQEALGLLSLDDLEKEQYTAFIAWADEVTAGARSNITGIIADSSFAAASASLAAYSAILTLDGKAGFAKSVGMTKAQLESWFETTALGSGALAEWVDQAFTKNMQDKLLSALRTSGVLGEGTKKAVQRVLLAASDSGFELAKRDAITITRTFMQTANVNAQEAVFDANRHLLKGYRRVETLDNRTCLQCALADGSVYGLDEKRPALPSHPRCRGVWVPIAKSWRDFGFDVDELEEVARPWTMREEGNIDTGGKAIQSYGQITENFSGWWQSLSQEERARTSLSGTRQKLLESGAFKWDDLWDKATGKVKTLKELGIK